SPRRGSTLYTVNSHTRNHEQHTRITRNQAPPSGHPRVHRTAHRRGRSLPPGRPHATTLEAARRSLRRPRLDCIQCTPQSHLEVASGHADGHCRGNPCRINSVGSTASSVRATTFSFAELVTPTGTNGFRTPRPPPSSPPAPMPAP